MENNQSEKTGRFISERRKSKNLIQKELAQKLDVKIERMRKGILAAASASFLIAICTCLICDLSITGSITWSAIVIISVIFSWVLLLPIFTAKNKIIAKSLAVLSVGVIPYLAVLGELLNVSLLFRMGGCISVVSIIGVWCIYGVFAKLRGRKLCAAGISLLIAIPVSLAIDHIVTYFIRQPATSFVQDMINAVSLLAAAILCFIIDYFAARGTRAAARTQKSGI